MIKLESSDWRVWVDPHRGAGWLACEARRDEDWLAIMPDCRSEDSPLAAANFHMLPYSNRIRDGRFDFNGQTIQLADRDTHAIHGAVRELPWRETSLTPDSLHCRIDTVDHPDANWPWNIVVTHALRLSGRKLTSTLTLENTASTPMPAGLGWHPYFRRTIDDSPATLTLPVDAVYPDASGECLPDGAPIAISAALDYRQARVLDPDQPIDHCFAGLAGSIRLDWAGAGIAIAIRSSAACDHLVFYNPIESPWFAVEPVTNANDAFNLAERGIDAGRRVLGPDESMTGEMQLELIDR